MKSFLAIAFLSAVAASPAMGGVVEVELPEHVEWCATVHVMDATKLNTTKGQQAVYLEGEQPIAGCARAKDLSRIGVPSLREIEPVGTDGKEMRLTFCAPVAPPTSTAPGCEGIVARQVTAQKVVAAICPQSDTEPCTAEISAALHGDPWKLEEAAIKAISWRFAQAPDASRSPAAVISAFTSTTAQLVGRIDKAVPPPADSFGVVAAPLPPPSVQAPAAPAVQPGTGHL